MFPEIEPFESGMLDVGDGQQIYWETCGNPNGTPVVFLHGGPGSGSSPGSRRFFDPTLCKVILFDQRGCGRSRPRVESAADLETNTTANLIEDLERLRKHLSLGRWAVLGVSWGSTLGLAYAQTHPNRVEGMVLACVTTTSLREVRWLTHEIGRVFPVQWSELASFAGLDSREDCSLVDAYAALLFSEDPEVREMAARHWCAWEDAHVSLAPGYEPNRRFEDGAYRLLFARLVTHYWRHAAFLGEDQLIRDAARLRGIPGILIHGRYDISSPLETAWRLHAAWPESRLEIVDDAGHGGGSMSERIVAAIREVAPPR